jgi:hypothetical protein
MIVIPLRQFCQHVLKPHYRWTWVVFRHIYDGVYKEWMWNYEYHKCKRCGHRVRATNSDEWQDGIGKPVSQIGTDLNTED